MARSGPKAKREYEIEIDNLSHDGRIADSRDLATAVLTALLMQRKLWGVRVHNVVATADAIAVVRALHSQG